MAHKQPYDRPEMEVTNLVLHIYGMYEWPRMAFIHLLNYYGQPTHKSCQSYRVNYLYAVCRQSKY